MGLTKNFRLIVLFLLSFLSLMNCSDDENNEIGEIILSAENLVLSFDIQDITVDIDNNDNTITINLPPATTNFVFETSITVSEKATLINVSNDAINFENPVSFTVRAENGDERNYVASVKLSKGLKNVSFSYEGLNDIYQGQIDEVNSVISVELPFSLSATESLIINLEYVGDFTTFPTSGATTTPDLSKIVLTSNDETLEYVVNMMNTENRLIKFSIPVIGFDSIAYDNVFIDPVFTAGIEETALIIRTLESTDVSNLKPSFIFSPNATISPDSSLNQNFNNDFEYTITSQNGEDKIHVVRVIKEKILIRSNNPGTITLVGGVLESYYSNSQVKSVQFKSLSDDSFINATINWDNYDSQSGYSDEMSLSPVETLKSSDTYILKIELEDGNIVETYKKYEAQ